MRGGAREVGCSSQRGLPFSPTKDVPTSMNVKWTEASRTVELPLGPEGIKVVLDADGHRMINCTHPAMICTCPELFAFVANGLDMGTYKDGFYDVLKDVPADGGGNALDTMRLPYLTETTLDFPFTMSR